MITRTGQMVISMELSEVFALSVAPPHVCHRQLDLNAILVPLRAVQHWQLSRWKNAAFVPYSYTAYDLWHIVN